MTTNLTPETYELIEQYLRNELTEKQLTDFKQRLETDKEFAQAVATETSIQKVVAHSAEQDLRARLQTIQKEQLAKRSKTEPPKETSAKVIPFYKRYKQLAAIAATLLLAVIAFNVWNTPALTNDELFAMHYAKPEFHQKRGGEDLEKEAGKAYNNKEYSKAIELLANLPGKPKLQLYKGIAELESKQYAQAISTFQGFQTDIDHGESATWYLALVYLKTNDLKACRKELTKLTSGEIETSDAQKAKAVKLLKQLDSTKK